MFSPMVCVHRKLWVAYYRHFAGCEGKPRKKCRVARQKAAITCGLMGFGILLLCGIFPVFVCSRKKAVLHGKWKSQADMKKSGRRDLAQTMFYIGLTFCSSAWLFKKSGRCEKSGGWCVGLTFSFAVPHGIFLEQSKPSKNAIWQ